MPPPSREGLPRDHRLRRRADYLRCYRRGFKKHGSLASLHFHSSELADPRLGITASRKVGKAVVRHRIKRRVREIFRRWPRRGELADVDIVVHVKPAAGAASFEQLRGELEYLFTKVISRRRRARVSHE